MNELRITSKTFNRLKKQVTQMTNSRYLNTNTVLLGEPIMSDVTPHLLF